MAASIRQCAACGLSEHARQPVPGTGPIPARLMIIDQAPGARDEVSGEPLSGQAGRLLDNMLAAIGFDRESAFITDVVKCRPMVNRPPEPNEIEACATHLQQQLALVQPACLLLFGNAAQSILNTTQSVGQLRETPELAIEVQGRRIPVVVTFHPNHLMANQAAKPLAWTDLKRVRNMLQA
ncbi:DNA polymerase [Advenella kashmirensis W13003]|uniref:Type-4 uracil-DNA glycosylase n=1 Tax=Advenella kashmirensis W13003 TaxID=1424334 RepID=V8QPT6_9BURK|nr:DNA polymerase [Advenella kashmirensis W13003]